MHIFQPRSLVSRLLDVRLRPSLQPQLSHRHCAPLSPYATVDPKVVECAEALLSPDEQERAKRDVQRMAEAMEREGKLAKFEPQNLEHLKGATITSNRVLVVDSLAMVDTVSRHLQEKLPQENIHVVAGPQVALGPPSVNVKELIAILPKPLEVDDDNAYAIEQARARKARKAVRKAQRPQWRK